MAGGDDDGGELLIASPCIRDLIKLAGVTLGKRRALRRTGPKLKVVKMPKFTKATTTPLVRNIFESFFSEQIDQDKENDRAARRKRCGVCEMCQKPDCGVCKFCKDMIKFGGTGKLKQCCVERCCPNRAVAEADDDDAEDPEGTVLEDLPSSRPKQHRIRKQTQHLSWVGDPIIKEGKRTYYR